MKVLFTACSLVAALMVFPVAGKDIHAPPEVKPWLSAGQPWQRDTDGPIVSLGTAGDFDDQHIFGPGIAIGETEGTPFFQLFYGGSRGTVADRVFQMGMALSRDGVNFTKADPNPVLRFESPDGSKSILTPCPLRDESGRWIIVDGKVSLYFSATDFHDPTGRHTLHRVTGKLGNDGRIAWGTISPPLLESCYSPTIVKLGRLWQLWYTDVSTDPWIFRKAESTDGLKWAVYPDPVMVIDQSWEKSRLFYPHVLKPGSGQPYLMWYGSYWAGETGKTALGFAASMDGIRWYKHPENPVFRPDPARPWESHYTTSHSAAILARGDSADIRLWYASRKAPPFTNKYFALNTAIWRSPKPLR